MWFEILPGMAFLSTTLGLPFILLPLIDEFRTGNKHYRDTDYRHVQICWFRDLYLTGSGMQPTSIDAIPDLPEDKK